MKLTVLKLNDAVGEPAGTLMWETWGTGTCEKIDSRNF